MILRTISAGVAIIAIASASSVTAEVTGEDIKRYFEDELNNRDVLNEYVSRVEAELQFFVVCSQSSDFSEAQEARLAGVKLQKSRKSLRDDILENKDKSSDAFTLITLNTVETINAAYVAQRTCVEHAANLKYLETNLANRVD